MQTVSYSTSLVLNSKVLLMYTDTVEELPGYPVQNSPSGGFLFWGGPVGRGGIVYDIVWRRCPRRTPWMMLRTPVCSYPIIVTHLSFNFLCLLLLYSIYLNGFPPPLFSLPCVKVQYIQTLCRWEGLGGGGVLSCAGDHIVYLTRFRTCKIARPPHC